MHPNAHRCRTTNSARVVVGTIVVVAALAGGACSRQAEPTVQQPAPGQPQMAPKGSTPPPRHPDTIPFVAAGLDIPVHAEIWLTPPWLRGKTGPVNDILRVPQDAPTIQAAIDRIAAGGHVVVAPGTYRENLIVRGKDVVIRSTGGPKQTVIDAGGAGQAIAFLLDDQQPVNPRVDLWQSVLTGFRLVNGTGMPLQGAVQSADRREEDFYVPLRRGGGVMILGCSPLIAWNVIESCEAEDGGGVLCERDSRALFLANWIRNNEATKGGGIRISNASPAIVNCVIQGNQARELGGGLYWRERSAPYVANNTIIYNSAGREGGGIYASNAPPGDRYVTLANMLLWGNNASRGGAVALNRPSTRLNMVHNALQGGVEGVMLLQEGIDVRWDADTIALAEEPGLDGHRPNAAFPGRGRGATAWCAPFPWDFAGQPRVQQTGSLESVDIGAIQYARQPDATDYWDLPELQAPASDATSPDSGS